MVIFRCDLLVLLAPTALTMLFSNEASNHIEYTIIAHGGDNTYFDYILLVRLVSLHMSWRRIAHCFSALFSSFDF